MYSSIYNFKNLLIAYRQACKNNRYKISTLKYSLYLENYLFDLEKKLLTETYKPQPYRQFVVTEPKRRKISAPEFEDRIVQHSLVNEIEPIFEKKFIYDNYACRKNKGTHFALHRVKKFLQSSRSCYPNQDIYFLKCDIKKFFQSISWDVLLEIISSEIFDPQIFNLLKKFIVDFSVYGVAKTDLVQGNLFEPLDDSPVSVSQRRGLPIGNLTSQLLANVYLDQLDQFVKHQLHQKWYGRYMDDFFIISPDKEKLKEIKIIINDFLKQRLKLSLHPNKSLIKNTKDGLCFVGYRIFSDHILIRGSTLIRFQKRYAKKLKKYRHQHLTHEELIKCQQSFNGHLKHANAYRLSQSMFR